MRQFVSETADTLDAGGAFDTVFVAGGAFDTVRARKGVIASDSVGISASANPFETTGTLYPDPAGLLVRVELGMVAAVDAQHVQWRASAEMFRAIDDILTDAVAHPEVFLGPVVR
ncbi:MAG: hypothetical protein H7248_06680, partial [Microbacteriaceae bacterium]|nr:hypothetical protein [Microbacteriaceae bacterium]